MNDNFEREKIMLSLSSNEALVLFEWLSTKLDYIRDNQVFDDIAEYSALLGIEGQLQKILAEPFLENYKELLELARRAVVPDPEDWNI